MTRITKFKAEYETKFMRNFILLYPLTVVRPLSLILYKDKNIILYVFKVTNFILLKTKNYMTAYLTLFTILKITYSLVIDSTELKKVGRKAYKSLYKISKSRKDNLKLLLKLSLHILIGKTITNRIKKHFNIPLFIYDEVLKVNLSLWSAKVKALTTHFISFIYIRIYGKFIIISFKIKKYNNLILFSNFMYIRIMILLLNEFKLKEEKALSFKYLKYPAYGINYQRKLFKILLNKFLTYIEYQVNFLSDGKILKELLAYFLNFIQVKYSLFIAIKVVLYIFDVNKPLPKEIFLGFKSMSKLVNLQIFQNEIVNLYDNFCFDDRYEHFTKGHLGLRLYFKPKPIISTETLFIDPYILYIKTTEILPKMLKKTLPITDNNINKQAFFNAGYNLAEIDFPI